MPLLASALAQLLLAFPAASHALQFPDTAQLKQDYRLAGRKDGRPVFFYKKESGDSQSVELAWQGARMVSARYERGVGFDDKAFTAMTQDLGGGGAWHEWAGKPADTSAVGKAYPGLEQQWLLKGYRGETGWLGSGLARGRFFLVFREAPPAAVPTVTAPRALGRALFTGLDTSSEWLRVKCRDGKPSGAPAAKTLAGSNCFSPADDSRLVIRFDRKQPPLAIRIWLDEGDSLQEIRNAFLRVPDRAQVEYARDLSQMLLGEAQALLAKLSQRLPSLFNWPSWQFQEFREGKVPPERLLALVRKGQAPGDSLPALLYEGKALRLAVNLYFNGTYHLSAQEKP